MVATCFNLTNEVPVKSRSLITSSFFLFPLWLLSEAKPAACGCLGCVLLLHFAKHGLSCKRIEKSSISPEQRAFLCSEAKGYVTVSSVSRRPHFRLSWIECGSCHPGNDLHFKCRAALQPGRKQAGTMALFPVF